MAEQIPLNIKLNDYASFDNFFNGRNEELISKMVDSLTATEKGIVTAEQPWFFYLWGKTSAGKTHLLQATCRFLQQRNEVVQYLPLSRKDELGPGLFSECPDYQTVCIDEVECIAGDNAWERELFGFLERRRDSQSLVIMAAEQNPANVGIAMPDLMTRLAGWGLVYALHRLDDREKMLALQQRALRRGLELPDEVAHYILERFPRGMERMYQLLDRIDQQSLVSQRRVTIPFLRQLQGSEVKEN